MQKTNRKEFRVKKVIKGKGDKLYAKWKGHNNSFNSSIDKKDIVQMSEQFPKPKSLIANVKIGLDLSNYATKADSKNATGVDISESAKKVDLESLKSEVDKLDIDKLEKVRTGLNSLKAKLDKSDVDKSVPVSVNLSKLSDVVKNNIVKKDVYNAKIKDIENKIPDITNLATNTTLNGT